jgi:hypothetical protein
MSVMVFCFDAVWSYRWLLVFLQNGGTCLQDHMGLQTTRPQPTVEGIVWFSFSLVFTSVHWAPDQFSVTFPPFTELLKLVLISLFSQ